MENIKKIMKWGLVLMAIFAYKQLEGTGGTDPADAKPVYMAYEAE